MNSNKGTSNCIHALIEIRIAQPEPALGNSGEGVQDPARALPRHQWLGHTDPSQRPPEKTLKSLLGSLLVLATIVTLCSAYCYKLALVKGQDDSPPAEPTGAAAMSGDKKIFDPTMSKKRKKHPFMTDEEGDGQTEETQPSETKEVEPEPKTKMWNLMKRTIFDIDEAEESIKDLKSKSDIQEPTEPEDDLDIMLGNKKKKKKNVKFPDEDKILEKEEALEDEDSKKDDSISFINQTGPAWAGSERNYTYEELLNRVFNIMKEKNPDMVAGEKRKFVMKPPQVVWVGAKKTSFVNFTDICKLLHRQPKHLLAFLLAELGTSGSICGNNQLVIKGRFQQKEIENVLRRYIKEYVTCHTC
ncbi:Eukaryotic translation initiation factor 2 subunit 2 [Heterocephalus glaber]|uniref:Eukaryotic translation initiation factor 2 subunit 2 n=1 Tax=Heterocephalus glaber TaxID=10181 RepID=G5BHV5_HETGA|nr:Eukaryotic translation initiation factor 2 subunit 2 [Heterocephalus glaber]